MPTPITRTQLERASDNAEFLDRFSNSTEGITVDADDRERTTLQGLSDQFPNAEPAAVLALTYRNEAEGFKNTASTQAGVATVQASAATAAKVAAEAARDVANTSLKVFTFAEGTAAGIAATTNGQGFAVLSADGFSWINWRNVSGVAQLIGPGTYTKAYLDAILQNIVSRYPYTIPFVAPDSNGALRLYGGFDLSGKLDLGSVLDIGGSVGRLAATVREKSANTGFLLPFNALDSNGVERNLGGFNSQGDLVSKGKKVIKDGDFTFSYLKQAVLNVCDGDSLTEGSGGTPYPTQLAALSGAIVVNRGKGGQWAKRIFCRQGSQSALITVSGNTIPTSGSVSVTLDTDLLSYPVAQTQTITGVIDTLSGPIAGTLTKDTSLNYSFTRTFSGTASFVIPNTPFNADFMGYDFGFNCTMAGANDAGTSRIADLPGYVDRYFESLKVLNKPGLFLISPIDSSFVVGSEGYIAYRAVAEQIKTRWPRNVIDVQERLLYSYNPSIPQDVTDFANKVTPSSLRADTIHLVTPAYGLISQWVFDIARPKGWI
jgi:hypothetical protein